MKYLKTYEVTIPKKLKYKKGDYVSYEKYENQEGIPCKILRVTLKSPFPYFIEELKPPHHVHTVEDWEVVDLSEEQFKKIEFDENINKYNL